jgi:hypothetical protein
VTQYEVEIQQLQTRNQETTTEFNAYQDRITTLQNELNHKCANAEVLQAAVAAAGAAPRKQPHVQPASIPDQEKFDGSRDKLQLFVSHLCMKLADNASLFPNLQHQLQYTFRLLVGQAFAQVEAYITNEGINLTDVLALITVLKTAFRNPDYVAVAERKLEALKQTNYDFSTYYAEFQSYAADIQWNDLANRTALLQGLNNEIKNTLTLSYNVPQQFQKFVGFLQ